MLREPLNAQYFVLTARALSSLPKTVARLRPDQIIICRSTIDALSQHPFYRSRVGLLCRYIEHLVSRGAQILESTARRPWQWTSPVPIDRRPEILACKTGLAGEAVRFFAIGGHRKRPAEGEERGVSIGEWRSRDKATIDKETLELGEAYSKAVRSSVFVTFYTFAANVLFAYVVFIFGYLLINTVLAKSNDYSRVAVAFAILTVGMLIYAWRERARLSYGLFEVIVGVAISYNVFTSPGLLGDPVATTTVLQFAAGLYAIVRGMDNVGKALGGTVPGVWWQALFEGRAPIENTDEHIESSHASNGNRQA